jgi:DNA-binding NarL/FixJ family response regulator
MIMQLVSPSKFNRALVIGASRGRLKADKDFLKSVDIREVRTAASGAEALRVLGKFPAEILICDEELADGSGLSFVRSLRADARHAGLPVIMASAAPGREAVLAAAAAGCAGYLARPYSLDALSRHIDAAWRLRELAGEGEDRLRQAEAAEDSGEASTALGEYERIVAGEDPVAYFQQGAGELEQGRFEQAVECFGKAVRLNELYVEAYLGLARSYSGMGLANQSRKYFAKAAKACLVGRRFGELRDEFMVMHRFEADGFNPFAALGRELAKLRDLSKAEEALGYALELAPSDGSLHVELARVYHGQRRLDKAMASAGTALALREDDFAARDLLDRLTLRGFAEPDEDGDARDDAFRPSLTMRIVNAVLYMAGSASEAIHRMRRPDLSQAA